MTTLYVRLTLLTILTALLRCTASVALAGEHPLAPDWQLNDVAGQAVRLSDFKGVCSPTPTTFIIDRAGRVVAVGGGNTDPATFEAEIKPLL